MPYSYGMLLLLLLGVMELVPAEPGKWGKSAVFVKGQWTPFDENDEAGVPQPYPPRTDSWMQNDTSIMVSISSFRDYRCPKTLYNLFTYALREERENNWDAHVLYELIDVCMLFNSRSVPTLEEDSE